MNDVAEKAKNLVITALHIRANGETEPRPRTRRTVSRSSRDGSVVT